MTAIADTTEEGYAALKFENFNFFDVNLVQLQFAAKPLLDLWKVTLDQHNTASGRPAGERPSVVCILRRNRRLLALSCLEIRE